MRVLVLALDGVFDSGLAVVLDTLETASALATGRRPIRFDVTIAGLRRAVTTHQGLRVPVEALRDLPRPDVVVMPALGAKTVETIEAALARADVAETAALLRGWASAGVPVAGACTATFVLAASGILDGGAATTTWWLSPLFRERFPAIALDESRMIVESAGVITAGAALAHVDLALWLVRRKSPALAHATARHLVFDARPSQAYYAMPDHLAHADPLVERFEAWARRNLTSFNLADAARYTGTSQRTLERRLRAVLGTSPLSYVQDLRVEQAVHLLQTTKDSIDEVAAAVGYRDGATLRVLLRRKTGRGIRQLRGVAG
ncbi:MAG: helix-turn-helix domain-containing protein [Kofleriaceae bacterium]|nr:helix-turn-helix domain-containing protein [Myxococcales bacterium]MCB9560889.1 helix-turn-helix domain-containing protein [Kofleriaceae bacterium]